MNNMDLVVSSNHRKIYKWPEEGPYIVHLYPMNLMVRDKEWKTFYGMTLEEVLEFLRYMREIDEPDKKEPGLIIDIRINK